MALHVGGLRCRRGLDGDLMEIDFPLGPVPGQQYTSPAGVTYVWDGSAWIVGTGTILPPTGYATIGDLLYQIRILLQDTDFATGLYRYSTESIILCVNQCMMDMYRMRPDLFLTNSFIVPIFNHINLNAPLVIEPQYVPPVIYYAVGLVQARDDEQNQDARAMGFLKVFQQTIVNGGLA